MYVFKSAYGWLFKVFSFIDRCMIQNFLENKTSNALPNLWARCTKFLPHLLRVSYVNNIIEDIITNTLFNDPNCNSNRHTIFLNLLLSQSSRRLLGPIFNKISDVFLYKYSPCEVGPLLSIGKFFEFFSPQSVGVIVISVFVHCIFWIIMRVSGSD